jgi:hypothetical protein
MKTKAKAAASYVFISDLAEFLKRERGSLTARIRRQGFNIVTIRRPASGQPSLAVTAEEAKRILEIEKPIPQIVNPKDL